MPVKRRRADVGFGRTRLEWRSRDEYLVSLRLQLSDRDLSASMGLHVNVQTVELFHGGFARSFSLCRRTELLEVYADAIERECGPAVRTLDAGHANDRSNRSLIAFRPLSLSERVPVPVKWI